MAKAEMTRASIPKSLLDARNSATAEFLSSDADQVATAFSARTNPKYNVVGVGLGHKIEKGKATKQHCVRFYVERKIPKQVIPKNFLLPEKVGGFPTDVIEFRPLPGICGRGQGTVPHPAGAPWMLDRVCVQWKGCRKRDGRHVRRRGGS